MIIGFRNRNFFFILIFSIFFVFMFFPGLMSTDSKGIYLMAKTNAYSEHHPPLMAYVWHFFIKLIDGPHLMFLFSMGLLWGAIYVLSCKVFSEKNIGLFCVLIPFIPYVSIYAGWVWKDILFTFGYGVLSIFLAYKNIKKKKLNLLESIMFFVLLLFCTAVKFQAKFILPILLCWFFFTQNRIFYRAVVLSILSSFLLLKTIGMINYALITQENGTINYSAQYRLIYDLAGISVNTNEVVIPEFIKKRADITVADIKGKYFLLWEPLITETDSPFIRISSKEQLEKLEAFWWKSVKQHPIAYLKHRGYIWVRGLLLSSPGKGWVVDNIENYNLKSVGKIIILFSYLTAYVFIFPLQLFFIFFCIKALKEKTYTPYHEPILFLGAMSLTLLGVLFFFSLASVPRYIFFCNYLFLLSCPFVWYCLSQKRTAENRIFA